MCLILGSTLQEELNKINSFQLILVAHAYNLNYSRRIIVLGQARQNVNETSLSIRCGGVIPVHYAERL
jgi:hypothetical protein